MDDGQINAKNKSSDWRGSAKAKVVKAQTSKNYVYSLYRGTKVYKLLGSY